MRVALVFILALGACTPRTPISSLQAVERAEAELSKVYADYSIKRDPHLLQHEIEAEGANWRVHFWNPELFVGGDATVLISQKSGKIMSVRLGQ